jgi:TetR/AcrR family transcriptional regulator
MTVVELPPARPKDQRSHIAKSAAELFARKGYASASMNEIAEASGLSKPGLYHHFKDKAKVLLFIAEGHVSRLVDIVTAIESLGLSPDETLPELIAAFMREYADAQSEHRVLTEDVRFLDPEDQARVLDKERKVVEVFANAIGAARPDIEASRLQTVLAMLLFGMLNWMFTWFRPDGQFTHEQMTPIVTQLFMNGICGLEVEATPAG